ncbi:MAG: response regulator [Balneolaceae bacterium]|nr:response regulator [Balneolaceae bacterium]
MRGDFLKKDKKVLIVEDNFLVALTLEQMVSKLGFLVVDKVSSGEEAISVTKTLGPDVILMDIKLNGEINGIEALLKIQETKSIPAVYISANSDKIKQRDLCETDYIEFLTKPVLLPELKRVFKQLP